MLISAERYKLAYGTIKKMTGFSARRNVYLDTHHEESWQKIQDMENRVVPREPSPELTFPPPTFTVPLQVVHYELWFGLC